MSFTVPDILDGEARSAFQPKMVALIEFTLGPEAASGANAPATWGQAREKLNAVALGMGMGTAPIGAKESGSSARSKVNEMLAIARAAITGRNGAMLTARSGALLLQRMD